MNESIPGSPTGKDTRPRETPLSMTPARLLTGIDAPTLDPEARAFLSGQRPLTNPAMQALWDQLWTGESDPPVATSPAEQRLLMCRQALLDPGQLQTWPEPLLEGQDFPAYLARLLAWTRLQEWMDRAPPEQESEFLRQLDRASYHCHWLEQHQQDFLPLQPWFWREKARLEGFQGRDPLPWLARSLRLAGSLGQQVEVALCRAFLAQSSSDPEAQLDARQREQLQPLLAGVPDLVAATGIEELRRQLLTTVLDLVPMEAALWLEKEEEWSVLDWWPRSAHPRYSSSLVEQCWRSQELSWGQPEQLRASRSILLSEVRCLLAVPVGEKGVLFAWQSTQQTSLSTGQIETLKFLARLTSTLMSNLAFTEAARQDLEQSERVHRRWNRIFHEVSDIALAELAEDGTLLSWNQTFQQLFPSAQIGGLASQLLPESERQRDQQRLGQLDPAQSSLLRIDVAGQPRWYQLTDWTVPDQPGSYRALLDVSEREVDQWFEFLEETRHRLAADLHDGPTQIAAVLNMQEPSDQVTPFFEDLRTQLDFLRSPWREGRDPWTWLQELGCRCFPQCRLELQLGDLEVSQQQCLYRILLAILQPLGRELNQLVCQATPAQAQISWQPQQELTLPDTTRRLIGSKLEILGGDWQLEPGRLSLAFHT